MGNRLNGNNILGSAEFDFSVRRLGQFLLQNNCGFGASRMAGDIIDAFFYDEEYFAARIGAEFEIMIVVGLKLQSDVSPTICPTLF